MKTESTKKTYNAGACEERSQILDHIEVLRGKLRTVPMTATGVLANIETFLRSRTERTGERKGGL